MKGIAIVVFLLLVFCLAASGQCADEPMLDRSEIISTKMIHLNRPAEISLTITALSFQTSWKLKGSEAATLSIFVDGKYDQDLLLFAGEIDLPADKTRGFPYKIFIGELAKGEHTIDVVLNKKHSASKIGAVTIGDIQVGATSLDSYVAPAANISPNSPDDVGFWEYKERFWARANAPLVYARPNAVDKFTDIPLVMYYEIFSDPGDVTRIRYTVIFTNEDGGTQSKALMARWGRMTDIEWVYEVSLNKKGLVISETYQAANHRTLDFKGKCIFGSHPVIYDVTDNNNFSDVGCSALRFASEPEEADLSNASRETVMDKFPWTYRIMAEEMMREGRVAANSKDPNIVDDPREYIYADIHNEPRSAVVAVEILTTDGRKFSSDLGNGTLRVNRTGYFRIAIHLPAEVNEQSIKTFSIRCYPIGSLPDGVCKDVRLVKIVKLDVRYAPIERIFRFPAQTVDTGNAAVFSLL